MAIDKTKKFADLAYEYIRKKLVKPSKGGITSLPTEKEITSEMLEMFEKLRGAGYNVTNIGKEVRTPDDLGFLINRIEQAQMNQAKEFSDAAEALETIQFKLNNNIPLNPEDQKKLLGKGFTTASDAFKGFKPKVIQGGKKEGIEQLLESGDVKKGVAPKTTKETIERKSMIDPKLTEEENIKNIMKENKAAAKRLEEKMKDPDKKAMGGRALMFKGGISKLIQKFKGKAKDKKAGDKIYGVGGEEIDVADFKKSLGLDKATDKKGMEDLEKKLQMIIGKDRTKHNVGGIARVGMNKGGKLFKFLSENSPFQAYKKYLQSVKRRAQTEPSKLFPELAAVTSGGILVNRKMQRILEEGNELQKERFLKEFKEDIDKDPFYKDRPELKDKAIENYTETLFGEKKAMGGRIGFKEGGGMTRRTFLKLLGGLASIPLVGKFLKPAAKVAKTAEIAKQSGVPAYFPKLVDKIKLLGEDISSVAATQERQRVTKYKGYQLTEDMSTGKKEIKLGEAEYGSEEYMIYDPPETVIGKNNKPVEIPAQYDEVTVKPDMDGKMKDVEDGLDSYDEVIREVGEIEIKKASGGLAYMLGE
tara:strand:+ start:720 stop:2483 length:1764 start_codon:yes stop_codon:yes gene_type:complete